MATSIRTVIRSLSTSTPSQSKITSRTGSLTGATLPERDTGVRSLHKPRGLC